MSRNNSTLLWNSAFIKVLLASSSVMNEAEFFKKSYDDS